VNDRWAVTNYYAVLLKLVPGGELSLPQEGKHAQRPTELDAQGKLHLAGWARPRVLEGQFQNITKHEVGQCRDTNTEVVVSPKEYASCELIYHYGAGVVGLRVMS
jgi:hypothetical protein